MPTTQVSLIREHTVTMRFRVDALDAGQRVLWTCTDNGNPVWPGTTLEWTVDGSTLRFRHDGFPEDQSPPFKMTADGWAALMGSLTAYTETGTGAPW